MTERPDNPLVPSESTIAHERRESGRSDAEGPSLRTGNAGARNHRRLHLPLLLFTCFAALILTACGTEPASPGLPGDVQPTTIAVGISPEGQRFLVLGTLEHGAYVSFNDGIEWTKSEGLPVEPENQRYEPAVFEIAIGSDGESAFAATATGLFQSHDSGRSWEHVVNPDPRSLQIAAAWDVALSPEYGPTSGIVAIVASDGSFSTTVLFSTDHAATWSTLHSLSPRDVDVLPDARIGVATNRVLRIHPAIPQEPGLQLHTADWVSTAAFSPTFSEDNLVFVGAGVASDDTMKRLNIETGEYVDSGLHPICHLWRDNLQSDITGVGGYGPSSHCFGEAAVLSPQFQFDGTGLVGTWSDGLARTTDHGLTWQIVEMPIPDNEDIQAVAFSPAFAESNVVFGVTDRRLLQSTDGGATWNAYPNLDQLPPIPTSTPLPTATPGPSSTPFPTATAAPSPTPVRR